MIHPAIDRLHDVERGLATVPEILDEYPDRYGVVEEIRDIERGIRTVAEVLERNDPGRRDL